VVVEVVGILSQEQLVVQAAAVVVMQDRMAAQAVAQALLGKVLQAVWDFQLLLPSQILRAVAVAVRGRSEAILLLGMVVRVVRALRQA
jgi:hypothetical protein